MAFWKEMKVSVTPGENPITGEKHVSFAFVYYKRLLATIIDEAMISALRLAVKEAVLTDPLYREQVEKAIKAAAASLPLEAITAAVKEGIRGEK
jgi:hypothetical protein